MGLMKMLGGMLVLGAVAAADVSTLEAKAKVDPSVAHFEALLAAGATGLNLANCVEMSAFDAHLASPPVWIERSTMFCGEQIVTPVRS
jgi:hypothetical protein